MAKLKIQNFGPIKEGYIENDGDVTIPNVTLFIGDQGTGESAIAKILSTCSWIEKTILKDSNREELNEFRKDYNVSLYVQPFILV